MKNKKVEEVISTRPPVFRVPMQGAPPPRGFAIRYVSGMEETPDLKQGYWLSNYFVDREGYLNFHFAPELFFGFDVEDDAKAASQALKNNADIETVIVKIGL